jgi:alpha-maltose-1-phosphate synthase
VTLGVGGAPYQKTLVRTLLREGMLRRKFSLGPDLEIEDPGPHESLQVVKRFPVNRFVNRLSWAAWRRIPKRLHIQPPTVTAAIVTDALWSRWIPPCSIFHGWMGYVLASLSAAKRQGAVTMIENAGRHVRYWHQVAQDEYARFNIKASERSTHLPLSMIRRMEREYEICDYIVVPSTLAQRSFVEFGYGEKTIAVLLGVDAQFYVPRPRPDERPLFRVLFVGRVELAKGVGYLLQAWNRLALPNAELVLVGEVKPEMNSLLRTHSDATIRTTGPLFPNKVAEWYQQSDLFVFPSVNDGFGQVLLEAMASGLPAIGTEMSGAIDCMDNGTEGIVVPSRNVDALADAILWCFQYPTESRAIGLAARRRIENQFTLDHYNQRQIALYRQLAA